MMIELISGEGWMSFLAGNAFRGALVLSMAGSAAVLLRRGSAAGRHWVWLLGLVGTLCLPVAASVAPRWSVELPARAAATAAPVPVELDAPAGRPDEGRSRGGVAPASGASTERMAVVPPAASSATRGSAPSRASETRTARVSVVDGLSRLPVATIVLLVWMGGVTALLVRLAVSHLALRRVERSARPVDSERIVLMVDALAREMGLRGTVRVLEGTADAMPMSWGLLRPRVLLPAGAERWPTSRLGAVLLHELAHVRRRDCLTQAVAEVAVAFHWMNPLAWIAAHRLRVEREHACDDAVLSHGARASRYASELVALARELRTLPASAPAAVAMLGPAHLRDRVRAVLDVDRPRALGRRGAWVGACAAAAAVLLVATVTPVEAGATPEPARAMGAERSGPLDSGIEPAGDAVGELGSSSAVSPVARGDVPLASGPLAAQGASCGMATDGWRRSSVHSDDDDEYRIEWSRPDCSVDIRIEGRVTFRGDFRDVEQLERSAFLRIEEDDDGTRRWLEVTPDGSGRPTYTYRVNRDDRPFDGAARAWYEGMLLQVFRRSGIMAEERVASMLRAGGPQAVLAELDALDSDHVFSRYVRELIRQADLSEDQAVSLVERARRRVDSDHYMSEILVEVADRYLDSQRGMDAFLDAAGTLESDHYRAQVLGHALDARELRPAQVSTLLGSVSEMESDHYVAEVLKAVAGRYFLDASMRTTYLRAVSTVESDHYRTEILGSLLDRNDLGDSERDVVLEAVAGMSSDHYKTEILNRLGSGSLSTDGLADYLGIVGSMESDHYKTEALRALVQRDLPESATLTVIRTASEMDSDHYKTEVLLEVAGRRGARDGAVHDALVDALDTIESGHYRGQVAEVLLRR